LGAWIFRGFLATVLVAYLFESRNYSPSAVSLPVFVAIAMLFFLLLDAIVTWRRERIAKTAGATLPSRQASGSFLESPRFYAAVSSLFGFVFLFPWLGYFLTSMLFVLVLCWLLGEHRWYVLAFCSVVIPLIFLYASEEYLKVIMPKGILFETYFF